MRESEKAWGGYLSISIGTIGTVFNLFTIIVVMQKKRMEIEPKSKRMILMES